MLCSSWGIKEDVSPDVPCVTSGLPVTSLGRELGPPCVPLLRPQRLRKASEHCGYAYIGWHV